MSDTLAECLKNSCYKMANSTNKYLIVVSSYVYLVSFILLNFIRYVSMFYC